MTSIQSGLKALIVADGAVGQRVYDRAAPPEAPLPYVTLTDDGDTTAVSGDGGAATARRRHLTVHVWQNRTSPDELLDSRIRAALDGQRPAATDVAKVLRAHVGDLSRLADPEPAIMHTVATVTVAYIP